MSSAAARMRQYRARQESGRMVLAVEVDEAALAAALIDAKLLDVNDADDRDELVKAMAKMLRLFYGDHT